MRFRSGVIFALSAGLVLGGCAAGAAGGGGPTTSPTGRVYEPGTRPTQTRFSQAATLGVAQADFEGAMASAREGIAADSTNPIHYFLAGEAAVGMGDFPLADSLWRVAERIYPAYELEVEPSREAAWANAFNSGVEAYNAGQTAEAIQAWTDADLIYRFRPEAAQNLAILLTQEGDYDEAIALYQRGIASVDLRPATRILEAEELAEREETRAFMEENLAQLLLYTDQFAEAETLLRRVVQAKPDDIAAQASLATALVRLNREAEATEIYTRLLSTPNLPTSELITIGVALFEAEDYERSASAFGRVTQAQPNHRDAWYNRANALFAGELWQQLVPVAEQLIVIDPLNANAALILANAYRELERNQDALGILERVEQLPVLIDALQLQPLAESTRITGSATGNAASAGTPVRLRFTFYGDSGTLGTQDLTITAPARDVQQQFTVEFGQQASAYKYEVLQ